MATVPVTGTITIDGVAVPFSGTIPAPAAGKDGVSPTPTSVASALAATPSFVSAVAAAVAPPATPVTPPVTTPPPVTGLDPSNVILKDGVFLWDKNFNYNNLNEEDNQVLFGVKCSIFVANSVGGGGGWLPVKNSFFSSKGYRALRLVMAPTRAGQSWQLVQPELPANGVNDTPVPGGKTVTIEGTYGPMPQVGVFATYEIPLSVIAPNGTSIWKFGVQDQMPYGSNPANAPGNQWAISLAEFIT